MEVNHCKGAHLLCYLENQQNWIKYCKMNKDTIFILLRLGHMKKINVVRMTKKSERVENLEAKGVCCAVKNKLM